MNTVYYIEFVNDFVDSIISDIKAEADLNNPETINDYLTEIFYSLVEDDNGKMKHAGVLIREYSNFTFCLCVSEFVNVIKPYIIQYMNENK